VGYKCSRGTGYTYDIWTKKSTCDEKEDLKNDLTINKIKKIFFFDEAI
jgi:hypothetical protein